MADVKFTLDENAKLTKEQKKELKEAAKRPVYYDYDSPQMSAWTLRQVATYAAQRREDNKKKTVSLRLSAKAYNFARQFGKGYTSLFSSIIDHAIDDPDFLKTCLD